MSFMNPDVLVLKLRDCYSTWEEFADDLDMKGCSKSMLFRISTGQRDPRLGVYKHLLQKYEKLYSPRINSQQIS